ncbi:MAG: hypothetical protein ACHQET_09450 [Chitinophagales bacterium]
MKKSLLVLLMVSFCLISNGLKAQVKVSATLNVGLQPAWGPEGYYHVEYYYLPDIDAYYFVPKHQFIYSESNKWVFAASLPSRWNSYDLYRGYKIIINEPRPYTRHSYYHVKYAKYRGCYGYQRPNKATQKMKVDHDDGPEHGHGNGHAYGHDKHQKKGQ